MSEPIVCARQWRRVMRVAGYRCQCTGACGADHTQGGGRCSREHDRPADKGPQRNRLLAAPADPTLSPTLAARAELRAWCGPCHATACRTARRARNEPDPAQGALFSP
ncbi:hypothetical protein [Streptomyces sp. HNM0574]|uniref:hypothetical protein n=1 Tax=Streptomyces sp. HNM0574 TaxID=2714954 RepID=UPI00146AA20B|nr:hypothetical protein [Streptomyces sp. HNM0574]NLU68477.1 hypothetical protein [Streptomyces sp. HNM0574]